MKGNYTFTQYGQKHYYIVPMDYFLAEYNKKIEYLKVRVREAINAEKRELYKSGYKIKNESLMWAIIKLGKSNSKALTAEQMLLIIELLKGSEEDIKRFNDSNDELEYALILVDVANRYLEQKSINKYKPDLREIQVR